MRSTNVILLPLGGVLVSGTIHNMFVGNLFPPASIHSLEFNDETDSLTLVKTYKADSPHAWISFDHAKKNIYGVSVNASSIASYRVTSPTSVELARSFPPTGVCTNTTSAFIEAMTSPPYYVFSAAWPQPCGMSYSVDADGTLADVLDRWTYTPSSGVHGLALNEVDGQQLLYSADLSGDLIWTHAVNLTTGKVAEVGRLGVGGTGVHPRHLAAHSNGKYLYVVNEANNSLAQFELSPQRGEAVKESVRYRLIPEKENNTQYWSAEVMLSPSERYLWATARAQRDTTNHGFISVFLLASDGHIIKEMLRVPTTTVGGWANAISPAIWSDEYAAMTDYPQGYVQMFKLDGKIETEYGIEYTTATPVSKVDIADGGCCANVIWYS
ncbi:Lactonase, 7-bladed beta-propeller-domain-containing protein [Echria macrotheca]|uniref:Lactonase, 7-bladed beta-propeller-domain-containing protein n=1 Tax=Echria macrotheca TaxID=438768 RepID=A0AAJ0F4I6_9PEZI|nr:Lactonase, 7-bladed beta-propeller-domain-containing protein [Echria macrotheca]